MGAIKFHAEKYSELINNKSYSPGKQEVTMQASCNRKGCAHQSDKTYLMIVSWLRSLAEITMDVRWLLPASNGAVTCIAQKLQPESLRVSRVVVLNKHSSN